MIELHSVLYDYMIMNSSQLILTFSFVDDHSVWNRVRETVRPKKEDQVTSTNSKLSFYNNNKKKQKQAPIIIPVEC